MEEESTKQRAMRKDGKIMNVVISDRRVKTAAKYKISDIPHPFTSREEYERSIQMPLGEEWNASHIVRKNTKPEVMTRAGRIIAPITLPKQPQVAGSLSGSAAVATAPKKKAPQQRRPLK
jgi:U3 small nucleolar RNA-associated protein 14